MLQNFENWLLEQNYKPSTAFDYMGRIERLCRKEEFTLAYLVENITSILPQYEITDEKIKLWQTFAYFCQTSFETFQNVFDY